MDAMASTTQPPLCVDMDGTLLRTDMLYESVLALLRLNPFYALLLPWWLLHGKAALKREIASRVALDGATLPYDERVVDLLRSHLGYRVLCTASDQRLAQNVAGHLGLFDEVLASDGVSNLEGNRKADALILRFGEHGFIYVGNSAVDLHVWRRACSAWVVNAPASLARAVAAVAPIAGEMPRKATRMIRVWMRQLRVHQWLKNLLVMVPLLASHRFLDPDALLDATLAFAAFSLCASGVYVLNDLLDLPSDRIHPRKRFRPLAHGDLPLLHGMAAVPALTLAGFALALGCGTRFTAVLLLYYLTTLAYSLYLKRVVMLDVVVLAGLYTLRIIGGALAIGAGLSFWLLAFSMFIFLSLAVLKRYVELGDQLASGRRPSGRDYEVEDLSLLRSLGAASGYLAVLVLALYINSPESLELYSRPKALWLLCPLMLYWVSRVWVMAHRGHMHDDPVVFAVTDRVSLCVGAMAALVAVFAI